MQLENNPTLEERPRGAVKPYHVAHGQPGEGSSPSGRIAFFLDHLQGGGIQKVWVTIAEALMQRGYAVDLVVCEAQGPLHAQIAERVRVVELRRSSRLQAGARYLAADPGGSAPWLGLVLVAARASATQPYFPALVRYLRLTQPRALYSATPHMNIEAEHALRLAGTPTRLIVSEHNTLVPDHPFARGLSKWYLPRLLRRVYRSADAVVAVSAGVAEDVSVRTGLPRPAITTIYNPVVTPMLARWAAEALSHPWFQADAPPVILGAGRLGQAKDFPTLIRAFARVRRNRPARLMILGEAKGARKTAKRQGQLMALAREAGVAADVELSGFVQNPFKYMARAAVFVLSSRYEGLGNVLIEAMACGCPVVSTDCPSGPAEILDNGTYGRLVPVGDDEALAEAIMAVLDGPPEARALRERAAAFSVDQAVDRYEALLRE
jgi:glycosyltransferase involved in cell wall biosynthesis